MKDEIKEILDDLKDKNCYVNNETILTFDEAHLLLDYITNLQTIEREYSAILSENAELQGKITELQEENERLKQLYKRTCKHLFNIGNDELARYFQAQISECNVFTTQGKSDE